MSGPIRVLVADDSPTVRGVLVDLLRADPALWVIAEAADGVETVELAQVLRPDVITMDVMMPRLDGMGAIAQIMATAPSRILVITAASQYREMDLAFQAIAAGALEVIPKPRPDEPAVAAWGKRLAYSIRLMAEVPVVRRVARQSQAVLGSLAAAPLDALGIVASTGGPPAIAALLGSLPQELPFPVLVAQHIAEGFTTGLLRWLAQSTKLEVETARDGERPRAGRVYLPPDGSHIEIAPGGFVRTPHASGGHCPSGNRLLSSIARAFGGRSAGVVLTGMGDDGARGLLEIRQKGGLTFAQDEATSVVWGMPQAAAANGAARHVLPPETIASMIVDLVGSRGTGGAPR